MNLEDHWYILRRREIKHRLSRVFGDSSYDQGHTVGVTGVGPQLSTALEVYLSLKGAGRPKTFETGARRAVGYLLEVTADKPIDAYAGLMPMHSGSNLGAVGCPQKA